MSQAEAAHRRAHRLNVEARSRIIEPGISAFLARVLRRESRRQLDLLGLPSAIRKELSTAERDQLEGLLASFGFDQAEAVAISTAKGLGAERPVDRPALELDIIRTTAIAVGRMEAELAARVDTALRGVMEQTSQEFPRPSYTEIAQRLMGELGPESDMRPSLARDLARSFSNTVLNRGTFEGFKAARADVSWLSIVDARRRESHGRAHGLVTTPGVPFIFRGLKGGMVEALYPGDPQLPGEERRYCRCTMRKAS